MGIVCRLTDNCCWSCPCLKRELFIKHTLIVLNLYKYARLLRLLSNSSKFSSFLSKMYPWHAFMVSTFIQSDPPPPLSFSPPLPLLPPTPSLVTLARSCLYTFKQFNSDFFASCEWLWVCFATIYMMVMSVKDSGGLIAHRRSGSIQFMVASQRSGKPLCTVPPHRSFPIFCRWNSSVICLADRVPIWPFQGRSLTRAFFLHLADHRRPDRREGDYAAEVREGTGQPETADGRASERSDQHSGRQAGSSRETAHWRARQRQKDCCWSISAD